VTTIDLQLLWLLRATDLTDALAVPFLVESGETWPVPVTRWEGAAGRSRAVRTPRRRPTWVPRLPRMRVQIARELQGRAGELHWARDPLGGKVLCFWDDAPITWRGAEGPQGEQMASVTMTLQAVTGAESTTGPTPIRVNAAPAPLGA